MKKVSEEELIDMILELRRAILVAKLSIPKSSMYDKTSQLCTQVSESSVKLLHRYYATLLMKKADFNLSTMLLEENLEKLSKAGIEFSKIFITYNLPKPRYCPYCNKPIIGKITKVYCNENHRRKYLQSKQS